MNNKNNINNTTKEKTKERIKKIYEQLLKKYGYQGWWPILKKKNNNTYFSWYHPKDYSIPNNKDEQFEIIIGTILTQNTSWLQVEKALINLKQKNLLNPEAIIKSKEEEIKEAIKPAGYFNQKYERLKIISEWFLKKERKPTREELLSIRGIGKETADSILLYAYKEPSFIIDAYTRRLLINLKLINGKEEYDHIKKMFEESLPRDFKLFQEYHALIVAHGKNYYKGKNSKNKDKDFLLHYLKCS